MYIHIRYRQTDISTKFEISVAKLLSLQQATNNVKGNKIMLTVNKKQFMTALVHFDIIPSEPKRKLQ